MNLTEKDKELFKALHNVESGRQLVDYLERLITDWLSNSPDGVTFDKRKEAKELVKSGIIDKINLVNEEKKVNRSQFV